MERVVRPLTAKAAICEAVQFSVHQWHQRLQGVLVPIVPCDERCVQVCGFSQELRESYALL